MTLWPVAHQYPLSMGFSRQEYWRGYPPEAIIPPNHLLSSLEFFFFFFLEMKQSMRTKRPKALKLQEQPIKKKKKK